MDHQLQELATALQGNNSMRADFQQKIAQMEDKQFHNISLGSTETSTANEDFVMVIGDLPRDHQSEDIGR